MAGVIHPADSVAVEHPWVHTPLLNQLDTFATVPDTALSVRCPLLQETHLYDLELCLMEHHRQ